MELRKLKDLALEGKKVFLRLDLNVPIKDGVITDDTRIRAALPTIEYILSKTNKLVIASHLGRPKGERNMSYTLEPVGSRLAELLGKEVVFLPEYIEEPIIPALDQLQDNQFILLENLRFYPGEKGGNLEFAQNLMRGFDFYVNDGFGTVHRADTSVVAAGECLPPEKRAAGFLIEKEVKFLSPVLTNPKAPFTVVMGGSKVSDKIGVILSLLDKCNNLLIGGAMAYTFLKYKGIDVGSSRVEEDKLDLVGSIYKTAEQRKVRIEIPVDHVCATEFNESAEAVEVNTQSIPQNLMGLDIGVRTQKLYSDIIKNSATVVWNGPMGVFEWEKFSKGSFAVARAMSECKGTTIVGGGDSASAINKSGVKVSHVSTGGGASLEFLEGKVLPGLKILSK